MIDLWLDDVRPAPEGWLHVKTDDEARKVMATQTVRRASLDHDLGACDACMKGRTPEEWLVDHNMQAMPNCDHVGTGYSFVCWMEVTGMWPLEKPTVHSANPVGRAKMQTAIDRHYDWVRK